MKSLLSISLLSVLLSVCNNKPEKQPESNENRSVVTNRIDSASLPLENTIVETDKPTIDGAGSDEPVVEPTAKKTALRGEMPDTSNKTVIEHGSPDKARNDSVKGAKTKGKF